MKRIVIAMLILGVHTAVAQSGSTKLTKEEKKKLVAQAKKFKSYPQLLKDFLNEMEELRMATAESDGIIAEAQNQAMNLALEVDDLKEKNEGLKQEISESKKSATLYRKEAIVKGYRLPSKGIVFRVQIGGYRKRNLTDFIDNESENIKLETNAEGIEEITVGQFSNYYKANELKKHLRAMGVKDAWIVPYKNGKRVALKEVVDTIEH
ncbi:MAG: hypothetical protein ABJF04_16070 [Reichenbachiella sp.]|uniref:hypothetical protein n=1 Tax=Reichenbachiella sp. TaxID=2184521 RepID=UPI003265F3D4